MTTRTRGIFWGFLTPSDCVMYRDLTPLSVCWRCSGRGSPAGLSSSSPPISDRRPLEHQTPLSRGHSPLVHRVDMAQSMLCIQMSTLFASCGCCMSPCFVRVWVHAANLWGLAGCESWHCRTMLTPPTVPLQQLKVLHCQQALRRPGTRCPSKRRQVILACA